MNQILEQLAFAKPELLLSTLQQTIHHPGFSLAVSTCVMLFAALLLIRSRRQLNGKLRDIKNLQRDLRAITAAAIGVGERVLEIERRQRRLTERQDQIDIYDPANQPYEQAIQMIQSGSNTTEIVDVCGISESEAELIRLMHKLDKAS
ncbi:MAG: DUF2802 domain-containing protein [Gammaproteobacteria bacterium]|nr:DUF2802 domain-containing protein [Gammaproteobacteria bacterium]MDH5652160.1 DUF2802 domain-containing protein [Gammaproteobacteria bacterium]